MITTITAESGLVIEYVSLEPHELAEISPNPFICKGGCDRVTANLSGTCLSCQKKQKETAMGVEMIDGEPSIKNAEQVLNALQAVLHDPTIKTTIDIMLEAIGSPDLYNDQDEVALMVKLVGRFIIQSKNREKAQNILDRLIANALTADPERLKKLYESVGEVPSL